MEQTYSGCVTVASILVNIHASAASFFRRYHAAMDLVAREALT